MMGRAREAAIEALLEMDRLDGYSNIVIDRILRKYQMDQRDSALATELFYGVLSKRITLDYAISRFLKNPKNPMDIRVKIILRCAAYQKMYLDRIPDNAVVNTAVEAVKAFGLPNLSGFVNGVLRNFIRNDDRINCDCLQGTERLSVEYSVPQELIALWIHDYGTEWTLRLLESCSKRAHCYIHINPLRTDINALRIQAAHYGATLEAVPGYENAAVVSTSAVTDWKAFEAGDFHVQDLSAQMICQIAAPDQGETVYDCCAAPGGKSFTMAEMMQNRGRIVAADLHQKRVKLIKRGADRLGLGIIEAVQQDARQFSVQQGFLADIVLCDVPCSGYGVIRRKPEIRYKPIAETQRLPEVQYDILRKAAGALKPGGKLIYATCTLNRKENNEVASRFLCEQKDFQPLPLTLPAGVTRVLDEPENQLTIFPFSGASDGFFTAGFTKKK